MPCTASRRCLAPTRWLQVGEAGSKLHAVVPACSITPHVLGCHRRPGPPPRSSLVPRSLLDKTGNATAVRRTKTPPSFHGPVPPPGPPPVMEPAGRRQITNSMFRLNVVSGEGGADRRVGAEAFSPPQVQVGHPHANGAELVPCLRPSPRVSVHGAVAAFVQVAVCGAGAWSRGQG